LLPPFYLSGLTRKAPESLIGQTESQQGGETEYESYELKRSLDFDVHI
jgi:hypothetical protein